MIDILKNAIKSLPFTNYRELKLDDIVFDKRLRASCESNQCGRYGKNYCCPPHIGKIEDCIERVKQYSKGVLFQFVTGLDDAYDFEGMMAGQKLFQENVIKLSSLLCNQNCEVLLLGAGPCALCEECLVAISKECPHIKERISSVEAHGIYVNPTLLNVGLKYNNGENTVSYCGLALIK